MTILFVCSGNTCRSPLAVAAWRALDADEQQESKRRSGRRCEDRLGWRAGVRVGSAGLAAQAGAPASARATAAASDWKADLSSHRARRLDEQLACEADLICAMTQEQAATVRARFGIAPDKVRVLGEYEARFVRLTHDDAPSKSASRAARSEHDRDTEQLIRLLGADEWTKDIGSGHDIADPFGGSLEAYRSCAAQIRRAVAGLRAALREELPHRR